MLTKILEVILIPVKYFASIQKGKVKSEQNAIDNVVQNYFTVKNSGKYHVHDFANVLIKAGIITVRKTKNKREIIKKIILRGEQDILDIRGMDDNALEGFFRSLLKKQNL